MKGTKKSIEDIGPDFVGFCRGGLARFSKSMKQRMRTSHERKVNSTSLSLSATVQWLFPTTSSALCFASLMSSLPHAHASKQKRFSVHIESHE
jgi:hypothetical protein